MPKSQSKPETSSQAKISKASLSLFDDEEEEVKIIKFFLAFFAMNTLQ